LQIISLHISRDPHKTYIPQHFLGYRPFAIEHRSDQGVIEPDVLRIVIESAIRSDRLSKFVTHLMLVIEIDRHRR
jgi:hypothetical protein